MRRPPLPFASSKPLRCIAALTCLALLAAAPLLANGLPKAKPGDVGLSAERLARIDASMQQHVDNDVMSGALGMIARNGKIAYLETWGEADRENGVPMREDTIFRIYSMTKPITSVAVMILYEEGKLFLNDPVGKYIPELASLQVATATADEDGEAGKTPRHQEPDDRARPTSSHRRADLRVLWQFRGRSKVPCSWPPSG